MKEPLIEGDQVFIKPLLVYFFIFIVATTIVIGSWYTIGPGEKGIVLTWENPVQVVSSGLHFKIPIAQSVQKINIQVQKYESEASSASKDLQDVKSKIAVNFKINSDDDKLLHFYKTLGMNFADKVIQPSEQEAVKANTALFTAEELITKREIVKQKITELLTERLASFDIQVVQVSITNFEFSQSFTKAIEDKVSMEQQALTSKNQLEQVKYEAEQRVAKAEAEARAIKIQAESINSQGGADYVQLQAINKWDGHLPTQMIPGQTLPFINVGQGVNK